MAGPGMVVLVDRCSNGGILLWLANIGSTTQEKDSNRLITEIMHHHFAGAAGSTAERSER